MNIAVRISLDFAIFRYILELIGVNLLPQISTYEYYHFQVKNKNKSKGLLNYECDVK